MKLTVSKVLCLCYEFCLFLFLYYLFKEDSWSAPTITKREATNVTEQPRSNGFLREMQLLHEVVFFYFHACQNYCFQQCLILDIYLLVDMEVFHISGIFTGISQVYVLQFAMQTITKFISSINLLGSFSLFHIFLSILAAEFTSLMMGKRNG